MIRLEIKGYGCYDVANCWGDVTVKQFTEVVNRDMTVSQLLSVFTGITEDEINIYDQDALTKVIYPLFIWINESIDMSTTTMPDTLLINGKRIKIPKDIAQESAGQNWLLQQLMSSCSDESYYPIIADVVAVMLQPLITGEKFNDRRHEEIKEIINYLRIVDVLPVAAFFLNRQLLLDRENQITYTWTARAKKYKQGLTSLKSLGFSTPCTLLHRRIIQLWIRHAN